MKNKVGLKILIFAGMIGFPAFFILFLMLGEPTFHRLPYFGEHKIITKEVDGKTVNDTIWYKVNSFSFTDVEGKPVTEKDYEGKIILANFFSGNCPSDSMNECPMNFLEFERFIYSELESNKGFKDVRILSHFIGEQDTVAEMKLMYEHHNINPDIWKFVKGSENSIFDAELGTGNYWQKKDTVYGNEREAYIITLLLDKERHIRGKYLTTQSSEISRITKEVSLLIREENKNEKESH